MPELPDILDSFCRLDGVHGALVLDTSGTVLEERFAEGRESGGVAQMVRRSVDAGSRLAKALGKEAMTQEYIEFSSSQITAEMLEGGRSLVIVADTGANLGRIRLEIRKSKKAVESSLA